MRSLWFALAAIVALQIQSAWAADSLVQHPDSSAIKPSKNTGNDRADNPTKNNPGAGNSVLPGANSFTKSEARDRIQSAGFANVQDLKQDDSGIWRGRARKGDQEVGVAMDYRGVVIQQ